MKIAQIVCAYPPYHSGIGNTAYDFAQMLTAQGHEIITFTPQYNKENASKGEDKIIRLKPWLKYGNGAFLPQLFFRLKKFDAIFFHYPFFGGAEIIWLYKKLLGKKQKLIIYYHMDTPGLSPVAKILSLPSLLIRNSLFKQADKIICSSLDYIEHSDMKKFYNKRKDKFMAIPFGIDINKFSPQDNKNNTLTKILFVGGLDQAHYFKGIEILLAALGKIKTNDWELSIVGSGNLQPRYEQLAENLKIAKQIKFLGKVSDNDLPRVYRETDFLVLPSINKGEAFGLVILEAMASGLPVIVSNLPGVRSVFENNKQGFLVEPSDINDLKNKLENLIYDEPKRKKMGTEARKLTEEKYSWKKISEMLNLLFTNI
ncbi:MAG: glycosyltransferase family 4 protein [Patescibacteria group bacterium]|nr:glycosyltransferase family 4 protein [Patescibacteria group bacterium]MDD4611262.1 glycosyltransferase family 4 protein [Patescibacteria group bacterium]